MIVIFDQRETTDRKNLCGQTCPDTLRRKLWNQNLRRE